MSTAKVAYLGARLIDPASGLDVHGDLLTVGETIADFGPGLFAGGAPESAEVVECGGAVLCPGLVDMRVFVGDPGFEHMETLKSASRAAAAGGVTSFASMPNTDPVIDDVSLVEFVERRAREVGLVRVHPMAALTKGLQGKQMTELGLLKKGGAVGFTDGDRAVGDAQLMRRAMSYATRFDGLIVQHAEEPTLARDGAMNEGAVSARLGLPGIPAAAEVILVERDLRLVALTGARYHVALVTCAPALEAIAAAKAKGLAVSCAVSPHHLLLTEEDIGNYRTFFKVSPPLRTEADRRAIVQGLADGTIDAIVSSHNPQDQESKRRPFGQAAFGAVGLETLLGAALDLYHGGQVDISVLLRALTARPAELLGLPVGRLARGALADLVLIDPDRAWTVHPERLRSKSKNTPFEGRTFRGAVLRTISGGRTVFVREEA
jgi:dihydroorotase